MARICSKCGDASMSSASFCTSCGGETIEPSKCKYCGIALYKWSNFCEGCGRDKKTALTEPEVITEGEAAAKLVAEERKSHKRWWQFWK